MEKEPSISIIFVSVDDWNLVPTNENLTTKNVGQMTRLDLYESLNLANYRGLMSASSPAKQRVSNPSPGLNDELN